jgi:hypothetical protein
MARSTAFSTGSTIFGRRSIRQGKEHNAAWEQHAPAVLDESQTERCRKMALAPAGRAEEQDIGTLIEPAIAGGERHDLRLADHGHGVEVEGVERLARWQSRAGKMPFDAAPIAIGHQIESRIPWKGGS